MMNEHQEWRYLSAMKYFGPEDILQCAEFIGSLFLGSPTVVISIRMRERTLSAANCLRHRISELGDPRLNIADQLIQHSIDLVQASRQQYNNKLWLLAPRIAKSQSQLIAADWVTIILNNYEVNQIRYLPKTEQLCTCYRTVFYIVERVFLLRLC